MVPASRAAVRPSLLASQAKSRALAGVARAQIFSDLLQGKPGAVWAADRRVAHEPASQTPIAEQYARDLGGTLRLSAGR